jgi:signal transduction histidine kinase
VLLNLLGNAAKFVPRQGGRIQVRLFARAGGLVVQVQDNGPGVPPEHRDRIFEKFHQAGEGAQRPGSTGLGLPISRQIVEHFGGRIGLCPAQPAPSGEGAAPDAGQGACFEFWLPCDAQAGADDNDSDAAGRGAETSHGDTDPHRRR